MKKFTGKVIISNTAYLCLHKKQTWFEIYFQGNDAPIFKKGQIVTIKSKTHFPITVSHWTNEHGQLVTDRVRGKYCMYSDGLEIICQEVQLMINERLVRTNYDLIVGNSGD